VIALAFQRIKFLSFGDWSGVVQGYKKHVKDGTENYDLHFDFSN
jgi:hypothetical protein